MGFLSGIFDFFKKIWNAIKKAIKSIMDFLGPLLPILIIALIVFAPTIMPWLAEMIPAALGAQLTTFGTWVGTLGTWELAGLALATSAVIAPSETADLVSSIGDNLAEVAGAVGEVAGEVISGGLSGLVGGVTSSSFFTWALIGFGAYLFLTREKDEVKTSQVIESDVTNPDSTPLPLGRQSGEYEEEEIL